MRVRVVDECGFEVAAEGAAAREMTAQERSALATATLLRHGRLTWDDLAMLTGLTYSGVYYLMTKIARVLPVTYDREERVWMMMEA